MRSLLIRTAQLRFCEPATAEANQVGACSTDGQWMQATGNLSGQRVALTSRFLKSNTAVESESLGRPPMVGFEFDSSGAELFRQITTRLLGRPIGIFLDDELLSAPVVQAVISDRCSITGLTLDRAQELVVLLNSGALPLQLTVLEGRTTGATMPGR